LTNSIIYKDKKPRNF